MYRPFSGKFTTIGSVLSKSGDLRHCLKLELTEVDHLLHVISCEALRRQPPITGIGEVKRVI